jgi:carbamoyltransferase
MYILGIWDGHDSGAALLEDDKVVFAANEERFTKRKLEVAFPNNSIKAALGHAGITPDEVEVVAFPTTEFAKTLSRVFPWQKESYYKFRRRKMYKPRLESFMHYAKYAMTGVGILPLCSTVSKAAVGRELRRLGFRNYRLCSVDHHMAHAATAAFTSGMDSSLVITVDGLGDGLSASISTFRKGTLERKHSIKARDSIGIFFEQATNIVGMRELEDEGKVMAMADYSYPFRIDENKLREFFSVNGVDIRAKYGPISQYRMLDRIAWSMPRERFSYMAQQVLEEALVGLVGNAIEKFGTRNVAMAGGVMSNIKANMKIRKIKGLDNWYIFPHMGDGGIAMGAAMYANYTENGVRGYEFKDAYLGSEYCDEDILRCLRKEKWLRYERDADRAGHAAELISSDDYVFWFQGRSEYGPRALGNRSILAKADSEKVKERLNLYVKQRDWYQPFAPSMLREDAEKVLEGVRCPDRFMTMAYDVREEHSSSLKSVMHVDMTARPQILSDENKEYRRLLGRIRKSSGYGIVLNTSFNLHGMPMVNDPSDAIETMKQTKTKRMFLGEYFVENKEI